MKIVLSILLALIFIGCSQEEKKETHKELQKSANVVVEKKDVALAQSKEAISKAVAKVEEVVKTTTDKSKEVADKAVEKVQSLVEDTTKKTKEVVVKISANIDASTIYKVCAGCHGANAEKSALGKSKVIKGWDAAKVTTALNGYKDGTYGGSMKGIMKGQVSKLSQAEIEALSEYISKLK